MNKNEMINYFRDIAQQIIVGFNKNDNFKTKTKHFNEKMQKYKDVFLKECNSEMISAGICNREIIEKNMLITYATDVAMLEGRHSLWNYDYMTFPRRIGEMWEPMCKLPFKYPCTKLMIIEPLTYEYIKDKLINDNMKYMDSLQLNSDVKRNLINNYNAVWNIIDSGSINMSLDLHFIYNDIMYNCDFKSGFSSNEKGNTNRLLTVASLYKIRNHDDKMIAFVRQKEEENNHYLKILKLSNYWEIYCGNECYDKIYEFTGFNIRKWFDENINWKNDISKELKDYLEKKDLIKYLSW